MDPLPGAEPFTGELQARLLQATHVSGTQSRYVNRLILQSSPYLRQHAHNPVNWFPWGDEAFAEARRLNRPVFLSIGYSTCHWCHVMEEESFSDETVATAVNAGYVAIKVDREERPDIDAVYMRAAMVLNGRGGWPLTVWLTPHRQPFFAGTYFPPRRGARGATVGLLEILAELLRVYEQESDRVAEVARALTSALSDDVKTADKADTGKDRDGLALVADAVRTCREAFDNEHGGLRLGQKFPSHVPVRLLLRQHQRTGDTDALRMANHTLEAMAAGGLYDHLAGGFHRYATDVRWRVPHFEKMLYDNALLVLAYAEAWQVSKQPRFARIVRETCDELLATFASPEGGFYSATDADSEGQEGKYFAWTEAEILSALGESDATRSFLDYFGVTSAAEFEMGNVLFEPQPDEEVRRRFEPQRKQLLAWRQRRVPPRRDDKVIAAWNGLAISAFAVAGRVFMEPRFVAAAARAAEFVNQQMRSPQTPLLARSYCHGRLGCLGFLEDHAFVAAGLLDLFEATGELRWFLEAQRLMETTEHEFVDRQLGGWFATSQRHEPLLTRERPIRDGAEPAGSSVALMNLVRLAVFTDEARWREVVERGLACLLPLAEQQPLSMSEALLAVDFWAGPIRTVVLTSAAAGAADAMLLWRALGQVFSPRTALVATASESTTFQELASRIPWLRDKKMRAGQPTAYVCLGQSCLEPTSDPETLRRQLTGT